MTPNNLLMEGTELMLIGMACVLIFLALLIYAIRGMSILIMRFAPEQAAPEVNAAGVRPRPANMPEHGVNPDVLAAIQAAIHQHRSKRG